MPVEFPDVDFRWLERLGPNLEESAAARGLQSIGDVDITSAEGLDKAARALFATKNRSNMELALRFTQMAQNRRAQEAKAKELDPARWGAIFESFGRRSAEPDIVPGRRQPEPELEYDDETGGFKPAERTQPAQPQAPLMLPGMPAMPGPAIPGITGPSVPGPSVPGPGAALSPSDEIIARAQGAAALPRGPRTAQLGAPDPLKGLGLPEPRPTMPSTGGVPFLPPVQAPQRPVQPPTAPSVAPAAPATRSPRAAAQDEIRRLEQVIPFLSLAPPAIAQAFMQRYRDAQQDANFTPEEKRYREDQVQRSITGQNVQTRQEWETDKALRPLKFKEFTERAAEFRKTEDAGARLKNTIVQMRSIMNSDAFKSGTSASTMAKVGSFLSFTNEMARYYGVPVEKLVSQDWIDRNINNPTALAQAFSALSNEAVIAGLGGSLGNQISNADRGFFAEAFPNLSMTRAGNELLMDFKEKIADRQMKIGKIVRAYRSKKGDLADAGELDGIISRYNEKNPIFGEKERKQLAAYNATQHPPPPVSQPVPLSPQGRTGGAALPPQISAPGQTGPRPSSGTLDSGLRWSIEP